MKRNFIFIRFPISWVKSSLINLPSHHNLSYFWNIGSFLGIILVIQLVSGFLLSINYTRDSSLAFESVIYIIRDSFFGYRIRWVHLNIGSIFFFLLFVHIFRGIFFCSFRIRLPWFTGTTILLLLIGTAFLGYVLPWGQISLWGATVITNLVSTIPIIGNLAVIWVWGGFRVNRATLRTFYSLHFLLPFILVVLVLFHIIYLHETGSSSTLCLHSHERKLKFHSSFTIKDILNFRAIFIFFIFIIKIPFVLGDPENFTLANPLISPLHIQPEWYFLFAYAILRSIPNKLGGVIGLAISVLLFYVFPYIAKTKKTILNYHKFNIFMFLIFSLILTWIGRKSVEPPFIFIGQIFTFLYFAIIFVIAY